MLASILPGLREVRSPFAAGVLLMTATYLLFSSALRPFGERAVVDGPLYDIDQWMGRRGWLVVASVVAYLVGTAFMTLRHRLERSVAAAMLPSTTSAAFLAQKHKILAQRLLAPFSRPSLRRIHQLDAAQAGDPDALAKGVGRDVIFGGVIRLVAAEPALYVEFDRRMSEAEFKDATAIPGLLVIATAIRHTSASGAAKIALVAVAACLALILVINARAQTREARSMYLHAVADGVVSTTALERATREAADRG